MLYTAQRQLEFPSIAQGEVNRFKRAILPLSGDVDTRNSRRVRVCISLRQTCPLRLCSRRSRLAALARTESIGRDLYVVNFKTLGRERSN